MSGILWSVPRSRIHELLALAEENDGLLTSKQARDEGIVDSVLVRLAQRGKLERISRGVYRSPYYPVNRLSQYREAILWAKASHGPQQIALSHETAFAAYGISDANPSRVHITVPRNARLRRSQPKWIVLHRGALLTAEVTVHEGLPITSIEKTVFDVLTSTGKVDFIRKAITDARKEGYLSATEAARLRRRVATYAKRLGRASKLREAS